MKKKVKLTYEIIFEVPEGFEIQIPLDQDHPIILIDKKIEADFGICIEKFSKKNDDEFVLEYDEKLTERFEFEASTLELEEYKG